MIKFNPDKHYLGKLCKHGHDYQGTGKSLRYLAGYKHNCVVCQNLYWKANAEKILEQRRKYRKANAEKISERNRKYYKANAEKISEQKRKYRKANAEKTLEQKRKYRKANAEKISEQKRKYRKANAEKISEGYIKKCFQKYDSLAITPEMIELKREIIMFSRLKRGVKNGIAVAGN